nr:uncharacterized protein LOC114924633 [Arachis hypogaea]
MKVFEKISFEHVPQTENKHADALATLGSRVTIQNGQHVLEHWVAESSAREERMSVEGKTNDWRMPIHEQLRTLNITKETRGFFLLNGQMFKKSNDGLLMKCVREEEGEKKQNNCMETFAEKRALVCTECSRGGIFIGRK